MNDLILSTEEYRRELIIILNKQYKFFRAVRNNFRRNTKNFFYLNSSFEKKVSITAASFQIEIDIQNTIMSEARKSQGKISSENWGKLVSQSKEAKATKELVDLYNRYTANMKKVGLK